MGERYVMCAGRGWPSEWSRFLGEEDQGVGVWWPIKTIEDDRTVCLCRSPDDQDRVFHALEAEVRGENKAGGE